MTAVSQQAFAVWWKDLERWIVPARLLLAGKLPKGWSFVRVRDLVQQVSERSKVDPNEEYKMVGVRWYGEGTFHRETVKGDFLSATYVTPVIPDAFIYNRLFAWKGSFAIVPQEHRDCFVSSEFPQFITDKQRLLPHYLYLFFMCDSTVRAVDAVSIGSSAVSRNRFKEEDFLNFEIPLPPLPVQYAIVDRWEKAQREIAKIQRQMDQLEAEVPRMVLTELGIPFHSETALPKTFALQWKDLERWSVSYLARIMTRVGDVHKTNYPLTTLGEIARVSYGIQKSPANRPGNYARPYLRVANVQRGELDLSEIKYINVPDSEFETYRLQGGDLLVCEGNSADLVGRPAIWNDEIPNCVHQNHILRVRITAQSVLPEFLLEYMQTPPARNYFRARAKFTTNLASINSSDLRELPLPLPPLSIQREIVQEVKEKRAEVSLQREQGQRLATTVKKEIEEMILGVRPVPELREPRKLSA